MKYQLNPYNYGLTDDELLDDLRIVAKHLKKIRITKDEYNKHGRLCAATFQKRFGSWGKALDRAGLKRTRYDKVESGDYISDVRRVAASLHADSLTINDYKHHGRYSYASVIKHEGPWDTVLQKAGLKRSDKFNPPISDEDLFKNLEQLWVKLGRQPTKNDFIKPVSSYSYPPYPRRFGTYRKALEAFIASFEDESSASSEAQQNHKPSAITKASHSLSSPRKSRAVSWRQRFLVMRRDNFKCRCCGNSPALSPGLVLHVDHVKPWSKGGPTTLDNLQTLCEKCNIGKSDLPMHQAGED